MIYESVVNDTFALRGVSLEANFASNAVKAINSFFPRLFTTVNNGFSRLEDTEKVTIEGAKDTRNFMKFTKLEAKIEAGLKNIPYSDLTKLRVLVPEGFEGKYVDYATDLQQVFSYNENVLVPAIEEYYILIANIITNKNAKLSLKDNSSFVKRLISARTELNDLLVKDFVKDNHRTERTYEQVFSKNEDVTAMFKLRYQLMTSLEGTKLEQITDYVNKIRDSFTILINLAKEDQIEFLSAPQLKNITEGAYEIARQVEFFAVNYYRVKVLVNTYLHAEARIAQRLEV